MADTDRPRLVGGVASRQEASRGPRGHEADPPDVVANLRVDRHLRSARLDVVGLDEEALAQLVAGGAAILARLAKSRADAQLGGER
jgi:hypothetical protein